MKIRTEEIIGGLVNASLVSYALILNPTIVSGGIDPNLFGALMTTTILVTIIFTIVNGLYANVPFVQSVYMGENAFFAFVMVASLKIPYNDALGVVFWSGIIFFIITIIGLRKRFGQSIPRELSLTWGFAVAVFLLYLALSDAGIFLPSNTGLPTIPGDYKSPTVITFFILAAVIIFLYRYLPQALKGASLIVSIIIALILVPFIFNTSYPSFNFGIADPTNVILKVDFINSWKWAPFILIFLLVELVDVTGTLKALVTPFKLKNEEEVIEKVMRVEGVSTAVGALLGQPTVGTYIESAGAVTAGARTGIASIITGLIFIPVLFFAPFLSKLPFSILLWATSPALATVSGFILYKVVQEIDFKNEPASSILLLLTFPGIFSGNLLLAFAIPMASIFGYEYLVKKKLSLASLVVSIIGLIILGLYHY
jgi:AGZA family xanthine/uracil permease-like MFS transporter